MKKIKSSLLAGVAALTLLLPNLQNTELKDIAKPHLGVYECKRATLGNQDVLKEFKEITLELQDEENFRLLYTEKKGDRKELKGKYLYDKEKGELTFIEEGSGIRKRFPLSEGKITVTFPVGKKRFALQFEQK